MSSADNAPSPQSVTSQRFPTREVCGLIIFFWLALLPFSVNYLFFHPDERHYTDAGIIMCKTHDYLTPRDADGSPRLIKPILTYWIVVAGYQLFGITSAAARIPFLLLGGSCIGLGSLISHRIFGERRTTLITAAILAVNPLICMASLTAIPDIVQCFSLLLSAYGWIGLLRKGFSNVDAACAFVGAGLAIATKGTPGLLLLAYSLLFLWKNPWKRLDCRPLLTTKWVALGIGLALGWYLLAIATHGHFALQEFIGDQVHSRLTRKWWSPLIQLPATPILFVFLI
ncbi:MAG: glycosyltransferase family 39 protein, partial [Planctomycetaceae bacterium]|nr:glycosyltransferase family 39 protein [Planctomycetaceae bacterium]